MEKKDYHASILVQVNPEQAFKGICMVDKWWTGSFKGAASQAGDVFSVRFGETNVGFRILESEPPKRVVWLVTDSHLHWLMDKKEWNDTRIEWVLTPKGDATQIDMTHWGLVPEVECFENCQKGWDFFVKVSLFKLLDEGKGVPETEKKAASAS